MIEDWKQFKDGALRLIRSKDNGVWHLSISRQARYPKWDEIKEMRYKYLPDVKYAAIILPPPEEYVNIHTNCFHVWELKDYIPAEARND